MPPSTLLLDLRCRNGFICGSCLASLRKRPPSPWIFRTLSSSAPLSLPSRSRRAVPTAHAPRGRIRNETPVEQEDEPVTVRFFEQGDDGEVRRLRDPEEFAESLEGDMESHLNELEGKLQETAGLMKMLNQRGAKDKVERLKKKYEIEEEEEDQRQPDLPKISDAGLTPHARRHVHNLNSVLRPAAKKLARGKLDRKIIAAVWGRYGAARTGLAESWANVPAEVWDCLWGIFAADTPENRNRMAHVYVLSKDMLAAGVPLSEARQLLAMEAMFVEGWQEKAVENWRRAAGTLGARPETSREYWELGVRMCALHGDLERAERAAENLFEAHPDADPRVLFQVVRMAASKKAGDKAWEAYRRLRALLGPSMQIEDYDEVVSCFLSAKQTEAALQVFVDMMYSGAIDVRGRTRLPSKVANHFFMGKWLKRLIGAGDLDGALSVLQFMQANGIMPAAIQVNGLIGAWLRSGTAENQQKAEDLAWAMIQSRRVFVDLRRREAAVEWPLKLYTTPGGNNRPTRVGGEGGTSLTFVPRANLETFSLMAENYKNRSLLGRLDELWVAFKESEIDTDAFMMNQLLEAYVQEGRVEEARQLYALMTGEEGGRLVPNADTFLVMYKSLAVNRLLWLGLSDAQKAADAVLCRRLFADMAGSAWALGGGSGGTISQEDAFTLPFLSRIVLHTFRKVEDYAGLIVALRALRAVAGFAPTAAFAIKMVMDSALADRDTPSNRKRTLLAARTVDAMLADVRAAAASAAAGAAPDAMNQKENDTDEADEFAAVIELYYRRKMGVSEADFREMYDAAARDLGVYDSLLAGRRPRRAAFRPS